MRTLLDLNSYHKSWDWVLANLRPLSNKGAFLLQFSDYSYGSVGGTTDIPVNEWTHLAATWRSSDGQMVFSKNGQAENTVTNGIGKRLNYSSWFTAKIGEWGVVRDFRNKFHGLIDEVAILNRALSSNEIAAICAAGSLGMCKTAGLPLSDAATQGVGNGPVDEPGDANRSTNSTTLPAGTGRDLRITEIKVSSPTPAGGTAPVAPGHSSVVVLVWQAEPGQTFVVESSTDLQRWVVEPASVTEASAGAYHATVSAAGQTRFYRLRLGR